MTTIYQPFIEYRTDGVQTRFTFGFPYLDRSHIVVTRDAGAPALFKFVDDHTVEVHTLFGEPLPADEPLKIFRVTPDLDAFADFKDASKLSALDLNRARLQVLYLIQERSGGIAGSVSVVISGLVNEIETISGALDSLAYSQGLLMAGLQTLDELGSKIERVDNEAQALRDSIQETIDNFDATTGVLNVRMDSLEATQGNLQASVSSQLATVVTNSMAQASRTDALEARIDKTDDFDEITDQIAASLIQTSVAQAKGDSALAKTIVTLEVTMGDNIRAVVQEEREARVTADDAFAHQLLTLQASIGENLASIQEEMLVTADKVGNLSAQWTMKAQVQRADGKPVFAGIGLAAVASDDIQKSEIVLQADRLVFVAADDLEAPPKPIFVSGLVDGSPTFIIPSNVMGDRQYPGRLLVDGSIEGRSVAAETITGDKLKVGTITTREIDVNLGVNLCPNSEFSDQRGDGLASYWDYGGTTGSWGNFGMNLSADWTLAGGRTMYFQGTSTNGDLNIDSAQTVFVTNLFSVAPNERYEFSAYTGAHRCKVQVYLQWFNANGTYLGRSDPTLAETTNDRAASGGNILSGYLRIGSFATVPTFAATAQLVVRKGLHAAAEGADSFAFFTKPMVAVAKPNQTRLSPYNVSGLGTKITPGGITTPYLSAINADMGHITAGHLDVGTIFAGYIRADRVDIIDTLMVRGGAITLGLQASGTNGANLWHTVPDGQTHSVMLVASFGNTNEVVFAVVNAYPGDMTTMKSTATLSEAVTSDEQAPAQRDGSFGGGTPAMLFSYKPRTLISAFSRGPGTYNFAAAVSYVHYPFNAPVTLIAYVFKR